MRASGRIFFLVHAAVFFPVIFGAAIRVQGAAGMSMHAGRRVYAGNDLPRPGAVEEALPAEWDAGVKTLAGKIATAVKPERAISLEVKNISSLGAGDVERIRRGLEAELRGKGIRLGAAEMAVTVTLSENLEGFVWAAEVHRAEVKDAKERKLEGEPRVMIIAVKKPVDSAAEKSALLVLAKRRVWQQPGRMLDFAIVTGAPAGASKLLVLGTDTFAFYKGIDARWELEREVPIPHSAPWPRNASAWIDTTGNRAYLPGVICSGDFLQADSVRCERSDQNGARGELRVKIPERENVDTATIGPACNRDSAALATGTTDWTQPDSIQGYVSENGRMKESGVPIEMDGPVLAIYPSELLGSARAVVRSLKTGNYEGYIVTATCSQ
jgi:hypothetical protein